MATDIPANKRPKHGFIPVTESQIEQLGGEIMARDPEGRSQSVFRIRFLSFFGVDLAVVVAAWDLIGVPYYHDGDLSHAKPEHILWAKYFSRSMEMSRRWQRLLEEGLQSTKRRSGSGQKYLCTVSRRSSMTLCVFCVERLHFHCSLFTALSLILLLFVASSTDLLGEAQGWRHRQ